MKLSRISSISLLLLAGASLAFAGPLTPSLPGSCGGGPCVPPTGIAGESTIFDDAGGTSIRVDWIVMDAAAAGIGSGVAGEYAYIYQIENPGSGTPFIPSLNAFTINVDDTLLTSGGGYISAADLDAGFGGIPGHVAGAIYPNLGLPGAVETDTGTVQDLNIGGGVGGVFNVNSTVDATDDNITWAWNNAIVCGLLGIVPCDPLFPEGTFLPGIGGESGIFFFTAIAPPRYGTARIINSEDYSTGNPGSDLLPVPGVPEPGTVFLLGLGLATLGIYRNRKRA
jgi:hypothetical protein